MACHATRVMQCPCYLSEIYELVLREYIGKFCAVYQDDIAIFSNLVEEHKQHVDLILQALRNHSITAFSEKSTLFADRIEFLSHYVSSKRLEADPNKLDNMVNWQ